MNRQRGFTLVEMIMVIVITGIIAGMVAVFIATPVKGYVDSVRRAGLTDVADLALKRMALEIRTAVPNSVRLSSGSATTLCTANTTTNCYLEFIPSRTGGRYCTDSDICPSGTGGALSYTAAADYFDVLGPTHSVIQSDFLVVYNTGQVDATDPTRSLSAYTAGNIRTQGSAPSATGLTISGNPFPFASPSNRFQAVPSSGPVSFACRDVGGSTNGTGELRRHSSYATSIPFGNTPTPTTGGALLADNISACQFTYDTVSATNGLVSLSLTLTREGESVTLLHQIHVDNMP
jgi:MSHA biogenesis protein MshO